MDRRTLNMLDDFHDALDRGWVDSAKTALEQLEYADLDREAISGLAASEWRYNRLAMKVRNQRALMDTWNRIIGKLTR
ncbi:hypothetical protein [Citricoccus nitrophenolicus]|uniref:hypothetical protein n=1 Tax=Citricoccus nitrophenolicus TaxID=863575 RepID=UPI0031F0C2A1